MLHTVPTYTQPGRLAAAERLYKADLFPFSPAILRQAAKMHAPTSEQPSGIFNFQSGHTWDAWRAQCTCKTHRLRKRTCLHAVAVWLYCGILPQPLDQTILGPAPKITAAYIRYRREWYRATPTTYTNENGEAIWNLTDPRTGQPGYLLKASEAKTFEMRLFYEGHNEITHTPLF